MERLTVGITGATGFIGKNLVAFLKKNRNYDIRPFEGDLLDKTNVEKYFLNNPSLYCIVHLAGLFQGNFIQLIEANVVSTYNLLEIGVKYNLKRIIHTSTGAVYGESLSKRTKEDELPNPVTIYGLTKFYAEECIKYFSRMYGINFTILRFPNVYGPGNNKGVIYNFLEAAKKNGVITIYGKGTQIRDFLFIQDAVEAIVATIEKKPKDEVINIGTGLGYTINQVASYLKSSGLEFKIIRKHQEPENLLSKLVLDIHKAEVMLDWRPSTDLKEGLKKTLVTK